MAFDQPALSMIVDRGTLHTAAADVEAALVLCPLKTEVSIPDFALRTVLSPREIVSVETGFQGFWKLSSSWSLPFLSSLVLLTYSDRQTIGHKRLSGE